MNPSSGRPIVVTVAYDQSPCAQAALDWATGLASDWAGLVSLSTVTVDDPSGRPGGQGRVAANLVERSASSALLVLGRHGRPAGAPGPALGAVSRECLRESRCPIALVGPDLPALPPRRLVLNQTECLDDPLLGEWATALAEARGLDLSLVGGNGSAGPATGAADLLVVGRAAGAVPTLLFRTTRSPVVVVPTDLMAGADLVPVR